MSTYTRFLVAALLMALAVSVSAAPIVIPRDTVIPVTLDKALSSATSPSRQHVLCAPGGHQR